MISAEKALELLEAPLQGKDGPDGLSVVPALRNAAADLALTVVAQAEQIAAARAVITEAADYPGMYDPQAVVVRVRRALGDPQP